MAEPGAGMEIAIVGMAGRFPGAPDLEAFWENLRSGVESIRLLSPAEAVELGADPARLGDPSWVRAVAEMPGFDHFDAGFFGLAPRQAEILDPQHRVLLELAWQALEDAGSMPEIYGGRIGVFVGATTSTYLLFNLLADPELRAGDPLPLLVGNAADSLATRISYKLDLRGPSYSLQCACSTSLVAVHAACQSLLAGECDLALAGGVSINLAQRAGYRFQEGSILSPDGHCRPFDARAQGTVFGSGAGLVALKRLEDARADGDTVRALILGSAVNNDGCGKVGYTAPSVEGQAAVITEALAAADVEPETISYLEAHGTATPLGDPVEIQALRRAFGDRNGGAGLRAIGSVKSNVGHLDIAAGIAGLLKVVLALEHGEIPPSLNFEVPSPKIDFAASPFEVARRLTPWSRGASPRRAGVSAFGIGGTNAHLVLEEAPASPASPPGRPYQPLVLSARSAAGLEEAASRLARHLEGHPELELADVAFTLLCGRRTFRHRRLVVAGDREEAARRLSGGDPEWVLDAVDAQDQRRRPVVFLFPGEAAPRPGLARGLYRQEPVFRQALDRCAESLAAPLGLDLRQLLFASEEGSEAAERRLGETRLSEPALFAVEYALARLWREWGVEPEALLGHSIGELVAACLAGVFTLDDALRLAAARGVACGSLAASPAIEPPRMEPAVARFEAEVRSVPRQPPSIPLLSGVTGTWITADEATDPAYWTRHLAGSRRLAEGIAELAKRPERLLLEVGPGDTLATQVRRSPAAPAVVSSLADPRRALPEEAAVAAALGRLWLAGLELSGRRLFAGERRRRVPLPTYPFERQRYWIEPGPAAAPPAGREEAEASRRGAAAPHPRPELPTAYVAPECGLEAAIAEVWQEVLGLERVGAVDNFFELGGDSFLAVQLIAGLKRRLGREVPVVSVYEGLTVRSMARLLAPPEGEAREAAGQLEELVASRRRREQHLARQRGAQERSRRLLEQEGGGA
jgi:acyl transferase domain-containing protein